MSLPVAVLAAFAFLLLALSGSLGTDAQVPKPVPALPKYSYERAVHMTFLYFWAQRSGKLPYQRLAWRGNSCGDCKGPRGEDLSGGWYEATNSLKFSLPFLHTFTQIAWNVYNYEQTLENINNLDEARMWVRIGAEYTLASYPTKYEFIGMFGIADNVDFNWQGPTEEWVSGLGFSRANGSFATYITKTKKSSEITGQAAAAMALASMTLRKTDPTFANRCLQAARNLFDFGHQYRGSYMAWGTKDRVFGTHAEYYPSGSYYDEMGLGAAFLYLATNETSYLKLARSYWKLEYDRQQKSKGTFPQFWQVYDWENKFPALGLLLAKIDGKVSSIYSTEFRRNMDLWQPDCPAKYGNCKPNPVVPAPEGQTLNMRCPCVYHTPWGLARGPNWGALGGSSNMASLALQYAQFLRGIKPTDAYATKITNWAIKQVNYVLGDNKGIANRKRPFSFMVGFGKGSWPLRPNHVNSYNSFIDFPLRGKRQDEIRYDFVVQGVYPGQNKVNKFLLYGAVLGGPKPDDTTPDDHWNVTYTEPTQDYTSAFMMAATGLVQLYNIKRPGQSDCGLDLGWAHPNSSVRARRIYAANDYFHNCRTGSPYSLRHIG